MAIGDFEDDFETYAGSRLFIGTRPPKIGGNTEAGYEAVTDWAEISINNVGSYDGLAFSESSISNVSSGRNRTKKGEYTYGDADFPVLWLPDQPGQIRARNASEGTEMYETLAFAVVDQLDGVSYFSAQVATFQEAGGGNNDARTGNMSLKRQSATIRAVTPVVPVEDTTP